MLNEWMPTPMFNTQAFLLFFAAVASVYWLIPRRWNTARVVWLVVASFHFYAATSAELAFLVLGTSVLDYLLARCMDRCVEQRHRRIWMIAGVLMNLGVLCYFKYANFFLDGINAALLKAGYVEAMPLLQVLVPFGISFYTFESISYTVDVYRRKIPAEKSLPHFLLFILFFPHLLAGPIVRGADFLKQTHRSKRWNWLRVQLGVQCFLIGLVKKMAIADRLSLFCDPVWAAPQEYSTPAVWLAVLAYSVRIYTDFSGYTDMAIGLAHLLGFKLNVNFNMPYLAVNVSDFWRRWHISLSSWLRDYVFIPLGGSRGSGLATCRNLMLTMLLGGLWHGAAWSYVVWGGLHGVYLLVHRWFGAWCEPRPGVTRLLESWPGTIWRVGTTFTFVTLAWIFFRPDLAGAWQVIQQLVGFVPGKSLALSNRSLWITVGVVAICTLLWRSRAVHWLWPRLPAPVAGAGYALCACAAMLFAPPVGRTFQYFTF